MKTQILKHAPLYALLVCSSALLSCSTATVSGQTNRETRTVNSFTGVSLSMSADVYLTQGPQSVTVEAEADDINVVITETSGNTLEIKTKPGNWRNMHHVKVYVSAPDINEITVSGSGSIHVQQSLKSDEIRLAVSGSGGIKIANLQSGRVSSAISGSGSIVLSGKNDQASLDVAISGSGSLKADELAVGTADVRVTGSGSARVQVLKQLETEITGSGSVLYKGNPQVDARSTGSGRTSPLN
jgi:hypothetical protein